MTTRSGKKLPSSSFIDLDLTQDIETSEESDIENSNTEVHSKVCCLSFGNYLFSKKLIVK